MEKIQPFIAGDVGTISGSGRSLGVGNGTPLQYYCLGNSMDNIVWPAIIHGMTCNQIKQRGFFD